MQARMLFHMPSTAICWSVYEFFKHFITEYRIENSGSESSTGSSSNSSSGGSSSRTNTSAWGEPADASSTPLSGVKMVAPA